MGARGPAPKPKNLRILEGNPGRLSINSDEPVPEQGAECPEWLSKNARIQWQRVAPVLEQCGLLTRADETCLAAYCDALANYINVTKRLAELDVPLSDDKYAVRPSPLVSLQKTYTDMMIKFGGRLGLSPSDRVGLSVKKGGAKRGKWAGKISQ